jgi:hypothetical protein
VLSTLSPTRTYYDANHMNGEFSLSLEPKIAAAVGVPA